MENRLIQATFQLGTDGHFGFHSLRDLRTNHAWTRPEQVRSAPFRFQEGDAAIDEHERFRLVEQQSSQVARRATRQTIVLEDEGGSARITLQLEMTPDHPVLRYRTSFRNLTQSPVSIRAADLLPWQFAGEGKNHRVFRVNQWVGGGKYGNFEMESKVLTPDGDVVTVDSGAYGQHCSWFAVRDNENNGLFAGWEFDGRLTAVVRKFSTPDTLHFSSSITKLNVIVPPNGSFTTPYAFIGLFRGDWDEAGYRTQRFTEATLAQPLPAGDFPYVMWDSWKYGQIIDENTLRRNAQIAAQLGVEVFVIDLGWATHIGEWRADPKKFPSGMRALSDYVHSLGMKFGLHFAFAEAAPESDVLRRNPDWTSSHTYGYFGAVSLCLSHLPVRNWVINEALRIIDEYNVDWVLQDGENMVKECTKTTHTHNPENSNWANAVNGLNFVVTTVQARRPSVQWENCEDGGNMMTFNMVRNYATSIAADDSGELTTRQAVFGVTYPFSARYADRYMPSEEINSYITRSYMFGGPWILMNRLPQVRQADLMLLAQEIQLFKRLRTRIRDGKVQHYTARPNGRTVDAIGSYNPELNSAVVFVYAPDTPQTSYLFRPRDLKPETLYCIRFQENTQTFVVSGADLARRGILVPIPRRQFAEIVYIEPDSSGGASTVN